MSLEDILQNYPELEYEDIRAVMLYAADLGSEEKVYELV